MGAIAAAEAGILVLVLEATADPNQVRLGEWPLQCHPAWTGGAVESLSTWSRPMRGPFSRSPPAISALVADHGLELVEEADGRMFPRQSSEAVIHCLRMTATAAGVPVAAAGDGATRDGQSGGGFAVHGRDLDLPFRARSLLLATGGHPSGRKLAESLGHHVVPPVPSLFSLRLQTTALAGCSGIAVNQVGLDLTLSDHRFRQIGRVLITHRGLSGPATLRLSSFAARALHQSHYRGELKLDWSAGLGRERVKQRLQQWRQEQARRMLSAAKPFQHLPRRLWQLLLEQSGVVGEIRWSDLKLKTEARLVEILCAQRLLIQGRGPFGEEFVTAGGVDLGEVNMATMESRCCPGLYLAGELLDVDGVTGGFNFQACWSGGWSGQAIASATPVALGHP